MYKFKRILRKVILLFLCFLCIFSLLNIHTSAIAVEVIGGSYAAYVVLAAALAAAGYTIASNQVSPEIFQGILDSPNSELVKALIGTTTMFATTKGQLYFNWTSSQWATFTNWVNTVIASGQLVIPNDNPAYISSNFNVSDISTYLEKFIPTSTGIIGYFINGKSCFTIQEGAQGSLLLRLSLSNALLEVNDSAWLRDSACYMFGSPVYFNSRGRACVTVGLGVKSNGSVTSNRDDIDHCINYIGGVLQYAIVDGVKKTIGYTTSTGIVTIGGVAINGTELFPTIYSSISEWYTDVINTGALVGDLTGIGHDVINPGEAEIPVNIDSYPDYQVGEGTLSIPDVIGGSIDVPLDRWIDGPIDLSHDPVPIDFTDWPDKTIDTTPDDVVPDVRLNPPLDIPQNPDIPWADTESYPIDYPIDTDTPYLPDTPNTNPQPPGNENTNRLKLGPILLSKFPFCLPWDLQHGLKVLIAPAEAPAFTIPFVNERLGINTNINIDLSFADTLARVTRWFLSALWVVILILITSKIIWK